MKTPKEKAEELFDKFDSILFKEYCNLEAKKCALIAVGEIIKALRKDLPEIGLGKGYWHSVKQEIDKL